MKLGGVLLALAGMAALGWGLFHLMGIGSCGGEGVPPCPPDSWPYFIAVPGGILLTVASGFLGGGPLSFFGIFGTVGVSSLLVAADGGVDGDTTFPLVFGAIFLLVVAAPVPIALFLRRRARRRQELERLGARGIATVLAVGDTGVTINDDPRVRLRLRIEPADGAEPFEADRAATVSRLAIPRAGDRYEVVYDGAERDEIHLGSALPRDPEPADPPAPSPAVPGLVEHLAQLNDLRLKGALTDAEFQSAKDKLLS